MIHRVPRAIAILSALAVALVALRGLAGGAIPSPELTPDQVVRIQLEALRGNDARDSGIEVTFRFASPANRASTGPLPRFARMIKSGYAAMLEFESVRYGPVETIGRFARQRVELSGPGGVTAYEFILERQQGGEFAGCWMTSSVLTEPEPGVQI